MTTRSGAGASQPSPAEPAQAGSPRDKLDRDLLVLLQAHARESTANLARKLGVARTTVVARLARFEREGVIVGYTVRLGVESSERGVQAFVGISIQPKVSRDVIKRLTRLPELRQLTSRTALSGRVLPSGPENMPFEFPIPFAMASRTGTAHVVTTKRGYNGKVYCTHLLRRSYREDGKVENETLGNISHLPDTLIDVIRRSLQGETFINANSSLEIFSSSSHG